ncbi:MAG: hypothetical protein ACR2HZ_02380 [Gemmatimonadaceae bacterium]
MTAGAVLSVMLAARIAGNGNVHFESASPSDASDTTFSDSIPPSAAGALVALARAIDFFDLPDEITPVNPDAGRLAATDPIDSAARVEC